ncbi:uncharacterized protein MKK02DRAFT_42651 [Dioszegia hungarica]|uniref:NAD(P)-binding protein n=1 Tax=Dioszegia hungarica TaxID=4972 RepID=A0AA38HCT8_9TREE|nr:uncharacterized protein MKK02DRAFT_42651 [Dioszegia hungarica]KAI9638260.1 hypothetical protein MKK02DRAFT_42651 [Dioszegia hungarica]
MFKIDEIFSVAGKVVVVTGGGTGLGKAIAAGYYENGAKVYITGRRKEVLDATAEELKKLGGSGSIVTLQGDVATKEGCTKIADAIKEKESKLDVLVNCAGVGNAYKKPAHPDDQDALQEQLQAVDDVDFNQLNSINVNGVFFLTAALVPLLRKSENPSVIIIASIAGLANQRATGSIMYGTTKAAAIHLGTLLAGRLSPFKIRVNTICPGIFPTEMTGDVGGSGMNDMSTRASLRAPLKRGGEPQEIVGPILLLSSKAGGYMHGTHFTVDGGRLMAAGINDGIAQPAETNTYDQF